VQRSPQTAPEWIACSARVYIFEDLRALEECATTDLFALAYRHQLVSPLKERRAHRPMCVRNA
jgi:hypothetical protein